jgi:LacI family transcriptional regulator
MTNPRAIKRATIYDVAEMAGVSYQTVSRVINNNPNVSSKTRNRVLKVIKDLNYQPNRAAQVLNTQRSHLLQIIMVDLGYTEVLTIDIVSSTARKLGYNVIVSMIDQAHLEKTLDEGFSHSVDGFMFISPNVNILEVDLKALCHHVPFVQMQIGISPSTPSIVYDQRYGAYLATRHLIDLGHRHIAEIRGNNLLFDSLARHEGWLMTLREYGLQPGLSVVGNFSSEGGYKAANELLDSSQPFTAVVVGTDAMAQSAIYAFYERGLRVPEDISVVGFDNTPTSKYTIPPLTTIKHDNIVLRHLATEYLVDLIEQPETPVHQRVLMPELVIRQSTRAI